ncbi:MAG: S-layer homology domain-containing protein [Clostridiales bacterium]|nr:S-layer homology domain-containing protein [Clostridiales bacterium]
MNKTLTFMAAMGILNGNPDGNFYPQANITRAEFSAIAARFEDNGNTAEVSFSQKLWL